MTQSLNSKSPTADEVFQNHLQNLEENGFTIASNVLTEDEVRFLQGVLDSIYAAFDPERDGLRRVEGYRFASNLVNKGPFFESIFLRSPVYDLIRHLLGENCILSSLNSPRAVEESRQPTSPSRWITRTQFRPHRCQFTMGN